MRLPYDCGEVQEPLPVKPGHPRREACEYKRNATRNMFVIVCPNCGHINLSEAPRCTHCWSPLKSVHAVTKEEGEAHTRRQLHARKRQLRIRWGIVGVVLLALGAWIAYENVNTTHFRSPATTTISAGAVPGNWAMFQRDPTHTGAVLDDIALPQGKLKWRFQTDAEIFSSPSVVEGRVYMSTGDRRILALDEQSGELIWEYEVSGPVNSTPAVAGDLVFTGLRDRSLVVLNKNTGELEWQYFTGNFVYSSPAVHNGVLYLTSGDNRLYAFDAQSGDIRWIYDAGVSISSAPAVNDVVVAVVSHLGTLHIVDIHTGKLRFDFIMRGGANTSPSLKDDYVYIANDAGVIAIDWHKRFLPFERKARYLRVQLFIWGFVNTLSPQKGLVWVKYKPHEVFTTTPVVAGDMIYVGSQSGNLYAFNRMTGEERWRFSSDAGGRIRASAAVTGQTVYVGDDQGRLYAIDALSGERQWTFQTGGGIAASPAIANGVLYLTSGDGNLYAIE